MHDCRGGTAHSPCQKTRCPRQCRNASPPRQPKPLPPQRNKMSSERKRGYEHPRRPVPDGLAGAEGRMGRAGGGRVPGPTDAKSSITNRHNQLLRAILPPADGGLMAGPSSGHPTPFPPLLRVSRRLPPPRVASSHL